MNKNLFKTFAIAAMAVLAGACAKEQVGSADGETVEMTFDVDVPETTITTKGLSDAAQVDQLIFQLFIKDGDDYKMVQEQTVPVTDKKAVVNASLVKQQSYEAAFWAQTSGTGFYDTKDLRAVKMNTANVKANEPKMDAFWANNSVRALPDLTKNIKITMNRALAQVNIGTVLPTGEDALSISQSQIVMKGVPTTLNVLLGNKDNSHSGAENITFQDNAPIIGERLTVGEATYDYVATAYVFAPKADKMLTDISTKVTFSNGKSTTITTPNVPIQRNYRTNILGNLFNVDATWNVKVDERFEKEITYDEVSANLMKGATVTLSEDYKVTIDNWKGINIPVGTESVLNLNGHRFANEDNGKTADAKSALVVKGKLTINGDGEVYCEGNTERKPDVSTQPSNTCISVMEGGHLIINGGNYSVGTDVDTKCNATIYVENVGKAGKVEIYGGTFTNAQGSNGHSFVLNQDDQLTEKCITVYGGTFIGFNPADNTSDGEHTNYVAEGYKAVETIYDGKQAWTVEKIPAVTTQEELDAAIANVAEGETATVNLGAGEFTTYRKTISQGKTITYVGEGADKTTFVCGCDLTKSGEYRADYSLENSDVTFKNLTLDVGNADYLGYIRPKSLMFENCVIVGRLSFMGKGKVTFKNCVFNQIAEDYNIWTYSGTDFLFDGCTFNSQGKCINAFKDGGQCEYKITIRNCHFVSTKVNKSVVELKANKSYKYTLYFEGENTCEKFRVSELTGSALYNSNAGETDSSVFMGTLQVWTAGHKVE